MQLYRDQFAHYLNVGKDSEDWELEGTGVEALSLAFNPQVDQYKTIISRNADATFNNYQIQSSVSGKRIYSEDKVYAMLNEARLDATAIETTLLEVDMADASELGSYTAIKYNVLIVINEFLGENATISYDMYIKGKGTRGTATISGGKPSFTAKV